MRSVVLSPLFDLFHSHIQLQGLSSTKHLVLVPAQRAGLSQFDKDMQVRVMSAKLEQPAAVQVCPVRSHADSVAEIGGSGGGRKTLESVLIGACKHTSPTTTIHQKKKKKEEENVSSSQWRTRSPVTLPLCFCCSTVICDTAELESLEGKRMCQDEIMAFAWRFVFREAQLRGCVRFPCVKRRAGSRTTSQLQWSNCCLSISTNRLN